MATLGAKILPFALKGATKLAPAIATGAATALGDIGIKKLFGGNLPDINIPRKFIPLLPPYRKEFTKSQRDRVNAAYRSGGNLIIRPTARQIQGGFLGTLASIGIPMAISLVSKMLGSGLQVDRGSSSATGTVYVPPIAGKGDPRFPRGDFIPPTPLASPPFYGSWDTTPIIGMGAKKKKTKKKGKGILLGKNSPFISVPILGAIF